MEELRFSIDEEKYDDRHGQVLSLGGWYVCQDKKMEFQLLGDGAPIALAQPERHPRPDVAQALGVEPGEFLPGFAVTARLPSQCCHHFAVTPFTFHNQTVK